MRRHEPRCAGPAGRVRRRSRTRPSSARVAAGPSSGDGGSSGSPAGRATCRTAPLLGGIDDDVGAHRSRRATAAPPRSRRRRSGRWPATLSAAITASPIGPQPSTSGTSLGRQRRRRRRRARRPPAARSRRRWSASSPFGTASRRCSWSTIRSAKPPGKFGRQPDELGAARRPRRTAPSRRAHPTGSPPVGARTVVEDLGAELVAEHHRRQRLGVLGLGVEGVEVRSADAGGDGPHEHLAVAGDRLVDGLDVRARPRGRRRRARQLLEQRRRRFAAFDWRTPGGTCRWRRASA